MVIVLRKVVVEGSALLAARQACMCHAAIGLEPLMIHMYILGHTDLSYVTLPSTHLTSKAASRGSSSTTPLAFAAEEGSRGSWCMNLRLELDQPTRWS
jgi:hypothetical protein